METSYLDTREGRDLRAGGDEDVLGVDDLLAAVSCRRRHLVLPGYSPKTVDVGHLQKQEMQLENHPDVRVKNAETKRAALTLFCLNR